MEIRVLIADHHKLCRSGIRMLVEKEADLRVVAEAGDGATTLDLLERETPDVLLLEVALREPSAPRVTTAALERWPHLAIVALTMLEDERHLREFFRIGVHGFVLKKSGASDMLQAIRTVHRGHRYVAPELLGRLVRRQTIATEIHPGHQSGLTPREREVCRLVAYGHTNPEISAILHISRRTVESHRTSITAKLDIKSRAELVRFAIDHGLLGAD
jgi:DNA-binding NarL/FixJ family response regulator